MSDEQQPISQPTPRRLFAIALFAAMLGLVIALSFGYADHDPKPHDVRIAVNAPAKVVTEVAAGLQHALPGGFAVSRATNARRVVRGVKSQADAGGLVVSANGRVTIVTAAAGSVTQQAAITAALTAAAAAMHRTPRSRDVAPLPTNDRDGLSAFVFTLALLIPSVLGSVGLFLLGMRLRLWWRVAAGAFFALLIACGVTLVLDGVFGALTGAGLQLIGIGFLGALSFVLFVVAVQAVFGLPGTGLAALAFIFVGNAISGGSVPIAFLPGGFRQIAPWLPNAAIVRAVRNVVYFPASGLGHPLLVLLIWPAASLLVLLGVDLLQLSARRRAPKRAQEIYATPGIVHAKRRLSGVDRQEAQPA